jgi:LEA14-like dessication related protein
VRIWPGLANLLFCRLMYQTVTDRLKWWLMGLGTLCVLGLSSCKQPKIPEYQALENFNISKMNLSQAVVSADLKYYNPNAYALSFKHADLDIAINGKPVGKTVLDTLIVIPRLDTFYLPVKMDLNMKQLFNNALSLLLNNEVSVKVTGTVKLGKSGLYFNMPVNYEGKQKLDW